ncbi:MAG: SecE: predicted preprotein translocase, subunit E [Parcubacteria group bacterium GW2011_GWA2_39_18]|nr:MAG: SecE: predicted preprotein translocase, subunit E [Parcubacteria group bacterium GW2011_GWA2_39_18]
MNFVQKTVQYFKGVKNELGKVNWPTRQQTFHYTMAVILISVSVALFLGLWDYIFTYLIVRWI